MSYTPTQWKAGDTVTSAKLNKMEQGIAGGANILIAHIIETPQEADGDGNTLDPIKVIVVKLDKTAREILDADVIFIPIDYQDAMTAYRDFGFIRNISQDLETGEFQCTVPMEDGLTTFHAATEDDYPVMVSDDSSNPAV